MKTIQSLSRPCLVLLLGMAMPLGAAEDTRPTLEGDMKLRLGGFAEGERDLGTGNDESTTEGFADLQGVLHWMPTLNSSVFLRAQGFAPTDDLVVTDDNAPRSSDAYLALREFWYEYRGLTSYPGELIRLGLQRLRDPDGQWFDRDIESVRWIFDTTLIQGHIGISESFNTWRTDDSDPPATDRDRFYAYAGIGSQWAPGQFWGVRAIHASDHADVLDEVNSNEPNPKTSERQLTWVDFYAHSDYYDQQERPGVSYWIDLSVMSGWRDDLVPATPTSTASVQYDSVTAWATDLGLRWRPGEAPVQVGGHIAFGSGSNDDESNHRYEQTGLHSNRSRYTGTRSLMYRYNEALQPDLGNMLIYTAYFSVPLDRFDASLAYHKFSRHRTDQGVLTDGIDLQPTPGERDLGDGLDLVMAWYFGSLRPTLAREDEDLRSSFRVRASGFAPGDAYLEEADDQYRVTMELTLWY